MNRFNLRPSSSFHPTVWRVICRMRAAQKSTINFIKDKTLNKESGEDAKIDCQCHLSLRYKFMTFNLMLVRVERQPFLGVLILLWVYFACGC